MELVLENGADDMVEEDDYFEVRTSFESFEPVRQVIENAGLSPSSAEITRIAQNTITLEEEDAKGVLKLLDMLEEHDDVQNVHSNFDVSDEVMAKLSAE
jgi:transcriptional/translational regulatory protein YebC/TACO1